MFGTPPETQATAAERLGAGAGGVGCGQAASRDPRVDLALKSFGLILRRQGQSVMIGAALAGKGHCWGGSGRRRKSVPSRGARVTRPSKGWFDMRRLILLLVASALGVAAAAGLASAQPTVARSGSASSTSFLPPGVTGAGDNWLFGEGDIAGSRYSPFTQINSTNVQNLHVDWNAQFNPIADAYTPETMPVCCPNNMMYVTYINGVAALNPATGATVWNYRGRRIRR